MFLINNETCILQIHCTLNDFKLEDLSWDSGKEKAQGKMYKVNNHWIKKISKIKNNNFKIKNFI